MNMLGYPTHFGHLECLKLIASNKFAEKRIGYLGLMLLLDEGQEVLMLVTNSLQQDFQNKTNPHVVGLALAAMGNICSKDMANDLASDVEKFFSHQNAYVKKKAALCACRIIRKNPDLIEDFVPGAIQLLNDKSHAVLLTAVTLIVEMIRIRPKMVKEFKKIVPTVVRLLKNLVVAGYVSEYDVAGITDPFLQVKIIHLFRLLATGDGEASEQMNDILAQVAINTEPTKNPGNAILYETVMTIMSIEAESGLRVLAVNILGRFLLNRDNNIRYVALNTLCKVVSKDTQAVGRHRATIVDCLKDPDISIRRRALDLVYALVSKGNVKSLVKELLNYLTSTPSTEVEFKKDLSDKIVNIVERFAPSKRWQIDTMISVLAAAGGLSSESTLTDLVALVAQAKELHAYSAFQLYHTASDSNATQSLLAQAAVWCIGEYGEHLISQEGASRASSHLKDGQFSSLAPPKLLDYLERVLRAHDATVISRQLVLTALIKLAARIPSEQDRIRRMLGNFSTSLSLELQQRSVEYSALANEQFASIRPSVLARMPAPERKKDKEDKDEDGEEEEEDQQEEEEDEERDEAPKEIPRAAERKSEPVQSKPVSSVLGDLDSLLGGGALQSTPQPSVNSGLGGLDLNALLGGPTPVQATPPPLTQMPSLVPFAGASAVDPLMMLGGFGAPAAPQQASGDRTWPAEVVYQANGLTITFNYTQPQGSADTLDVVAQFANSSDSDMADLDFQVAVPKYITLTMQRASSSTVPKRNQGVSTQNIRFVNTNPQKKIVIRVKINYTVGGQAQSYQAQISQFPC